MSSSLNWSFLDATDGHSPEQIASEHAALLPRSFWGNNTIKPGAFGCFVSHYRAWQICEKSKRPLLVFEDDIELNAGFSQTAELARQDTYDLIFMNRRMVEWRKFYETARGLRWLPSRKLKNWLAAKLTESTYWFSGRNGLDVTSVSTVVHGIEAAGLIPRNWDAAGTDCYLVTPKGARLLIDLANFCGAAVGVDWFIVGASLLGRRTLCRWAMPRLSAEHVIADRSLNAGIAVNWLADGNEKRVGGSVINHSAVVDLAWYRSRLRQT